MRIFPLYRHLLSWLSGNWSILFLASLILTAITVLGGAFFVQGKTLMEAELHERLRTLTTTTSFLFAGEDLENITTEDDANTDNYKRLVLLLNRVRTENPDIRFLYILRPTEDPMTYTFVADADSYNPFPPYYDLNLDGIIDDQDELAAPGATYDVSEIPHITEALMRTITMTEPYSDQWGTYISGFAPIKDRHGDTKAILGVDIDIKRFQELSQRVFSPTAFLAILLIGLTLTTTVVLYVHNRRLENLQRFGEERASLLQLIFHQLGQPLTILKWSMESLQESRMQNGDPIISTHVEDVQDAINRLDVIFKELHVVDKIQSDSFEYREESVDLKKMIEGIISTSERKLKRKNQTLDTQLESVSAVHVDGKMLAAAMQELLDNAMDFSHDGAEIGILLARRHGMAEITVTDHGCGIPLLDQPKIFQQFMRGSNANTMKTDGNGLGLFIAKSIIEKAGGKMRIKSVEGEGTVVHFTLPLT